MLLFSFILKAVFHLCNHHIVVIILTEAAFTSDKHVGADQYLKSIRQVVGNLWSYQGILMIQPQIGKQFHTQRFTQKIFACEEGHGVFKFILNDLFIIA